MLVGRGLAAVRAECQTRMSKDNVAPPLSSFAYSRDRQSRGTTNKGASKKPKSEAGEMARGMPGASWLPPPRDTETLGSRSQHCSAAWTAATPRGPFLPPGCRLAEDQGPRAACRVAERERQRLIYHRIFRHERTATLPVMNEGTSVLLTRRVKKKWRREKALNPSLFSRRHGATCCTARAAEVALWADPAARVEGVPATKLEGASNGATQAEAPPRFYVLHDRQEARQAGQPQAGKRH